MSWACLHDRELLVPGDGGPTCPACGRQYDCVDGVPVFVDGDTERQRAERRIPLLDELGSLMQTETPDEAAAQVCARHGCSRNPYSADWKFFFSAPRDGRVLEIGAGFGDDSVDLAGRARSLLLLVPNVANGRIVRRHLESRQAAAAEVAVVPDLTRLPLADGTVDAITMEDAAGPAFGLSGATLPAIAAEWRRVLSPGGTVFLGLGNRLDRRIGLRALRARLTRSRSDSLNRLVKRAGGGSERTALGLNRTTREMRRLGFGPPLIYSPLPDEKQTQLVIPADDARVIRYFLNNMVRKNSPAVRIALGGAHLLARLGLFRHFLPYFYLIFRLEAPPGHRDGPRA